MKILRNLILLVAAALSLLLLLGCAYADLADVLLEEFHPLVEFLLRETPERKLDAYLAAIRRGDREGALAAWMVSDRASDELLARREQVTDELLALGSSLHYDVVEVEWWSNCCEPHRIENPAQAGAARMHLAITRANDTRVWLYTFDVVTTRPYWGAAGGDPIRRWLLRDVYPTGERPLAFGWPVQ